MDQKQQIADRLKQANNILVTVSSNPSVDQLASCIGLTLVLNKLGKHATAVFSGEVPSTIEFLEPEKTLEKDTNSLRDFIIALDKSKADKLRYKVEDKVVKIFITPYRTSISEKDLDFSQGDFNVDVVIALGVHAQTELDQAITSHGRILHDATIATLNIKPGGELGSINWLDAGASSLSELVVQLIDVIDKKLVDNQIATALLTGIVAETARFSNEKTSPATMSVSAELMAAGANQQLVATKLEEPVSLPPQEPPAPPAPAPDGAAPSKSEDGTLEIGHAEAPGAEPAPHHPPESASEKHEETPASTRNLHDLESENAAGNPEPEAEEEETPLAQIKIDEQGGLHSMAEAGAKQPEHGNTDPIQHMGGSRMILQPPAMSGPMNSGGAPDEGFGNSSDPLSLPNPSDPTAAPPSFASPASAATAAAPAAPFMPASMTPPPPQLPAAPPLEPPQPQPVPTGPAGSDPASIAPFGPPPLAPVDQPPVAPAPALAQDDLTLNELEQRVSAHDAPPAAPSEDTTHVDNARNAVIDAIAAQPQPPGPIQALNAQPLGEPLHDTAPSVTGVPPAPDLTAPQGPPPPPQLPGNESHDGQIPPPPVPPPMMPPPQ